MPKKWKLKQRKFEIATPEAPLVTETADAIPAVLKEDPLQRLRPKFAAPLPATPPEVPSLVPSFITNDDPKDSTDAPSYTRLGDDLVMTTENESSLVPFKDKV